MKKQDKKSKNKFPASSIEISDVRAGEIPDQEMRSFVDGASVIDIGELRRAQANLDAHLSEDDFEEDNLTAEDEEEEIAGSNSPVSAAANEPAQTTTQETMQAAMQTTAAEQTDASDDSIRFDLSQGLNPEIDHPIRHSAQENDGIESHSRSDEEDAEREIIETAEVILDQKIHLDELNEPLPMAEAFAHSSVTSDEGRELSLDDEATLIFKELESDPALKKDVLSDFDRFESNEELDRIASRVTEQEINQIKEMELLAGEVTEEMQVLNQVFIDEDKLLESTIARDEAIAAADAASEDIETEEMSEEDAALKAALPHADENGQYDLDDLQSCIEALLFYSDRPASLKKLKDMLEMSESEDAPLLAAIEKLKASYQTSAHGFEVAEIAGGYQLRTKASKAALLRKLAKVQVQRLSRGAMETLTICAYKQPCTKDEIDQVRGVDSSHFMRTLLDRKLIEVSGRSEAAGRPMIYATTDTFLEVFGLMDLKGMPPLREIEAMVPQMVASEEGAEDPRVMQMRKMVHQMKTESNHLDYNPREDDRILQEIRERVKSIDISSPYLARQKALAEEGIVGDEAEAVLAREFGFDRASSGGENIAEADAHGDQPEAQAEQQGELLVDAHLASSHSSESISPAELSDEEN